MVDIVPCGAGDEAVVDAGVAGAGADEGGVAAVVGGGVTVVSVLVCA
jgi:hypothetical protein